MSKIDELAKVLIDSTEIKDKKKTSAYDTTARVVAVEGNTAWVSIAGGVEKTPASMVVAAKVGDDVRVRVGGGKAYVTGNQSAPPTDDSYARKAEEQAIRAYRAADSASKSATEAQKSANSAIDSARVAGESATKAIADAATAHEAADQAVADAATAKASADAAQADATAAHTAAENAQADATSALENAAIAQASADSAIASAGEALDSAISANQSAINALRSLGNVEQVVNTLEWISEHGIYEVSADTEVNPTNMYFTLDATEIEEPVGNPSTRKYYERSGSGTEQSPYIYTLSTDTAVDSEKTYYSVFALEVQTPTGNPSEIPYYELRIDSAVSQYVSTHLALTDNGLSIVKDGSSGYITITNQGVEIINAVGAVVASYGTSAVIGNPNAFHIEIDGEELAFYQTATAKVAYIRNNQLFIPQSVVLDQMDVGLPFGEINPSTGETSYGQWSWKLHLNAESPRRNNLTLKWIG